MGLGRDDRGRDLASLKPVANKGTGGSLAAGCRRELDFGDESAGGTIWGD